MASKPCVQVIHRNSERRRPDRPQAAQSAMDSDLAAAKALKDAVAG